MVSERLKPIICRTCGKVFYHTDINYSHCFEKPGTQITFWDIDRILEEDGRRL